MLHAAGCYKPDDALWALPGQAQEALRRWEPRCQASTSLETGTQREKSRDTVALVLRRSKSRLTRIHTPEVWDSRTSLQPSITMAVSGGRSCLNPRFLERVQRQSDYITEWVTLRSNK